MINEITRSGCRTITRSSSRTTTSPLTDDRVSITDHDLMIVHREPGVLLTTQNPSRASLTWEGAREPAPNSSAASETSPTLMPSTRPEVVSDEAVMVATVAEPVAEAVEHHKIQAGADDPRKSTPSASRASSMPMPLSTRTVLKPPPGSRSRDHSGDQQQSSSMAIVRCLRV